MKTSERPTNWRAALRGLRSTRGRHAPAEPAREIDVLILGPVPPPLGGISVHISRLVPLLQRAGLSVQVLNHFDSTEPTFVVGTLKRNPLRYYLLPRKISTRVLHYHHSHWSLLMAVASGKRRARTRYVLTAHGEDLPQRLESRLPLLARLTRWALRRFDLIIVVNDQIRRALEAHDVNRPFEVLPAFLPDQEAESPYDTSLEAFLSAGPTLVVPAFRVQFLTDGRDVYGLDTVVDAFAALAAERPDLRLIVFVAEEPTGRRASRYLGDLVDRVERVGLKDRALVLFGLPLTPAFRHDDVVVVRPSRMDGDALSIREALGAAIPVVASDVVDRPPGVATFLADDVADLTRAIREVLDKATDSAKHENRPAGGTPGEPDFLPTLIRIYREQMER